MRNYYDNVWKEKLSLPQYSSLDLRWRSRWDFAYNKITANSTVLDIGCGDGVLGSFLIKDKNCSVSGVDISEHALTLSKNKRLNVELCDISENVFPFEKDSFDFVVSSCSLEHIFNPLHAVTETVRVLKKGGCAIITLPNVAYISNRISFLFGRTSKEFLHTNPGEGMHLQFYNYSNEFELEVLSKIDNIKCVFKKGDLKNPKKYKKLSRLIRKLLIVIRPNLFAQYSHWVIIKT